MKDPSNRRATHLRALFTLLLALVPLVGVGVPAGPALALSNANSNGKYTICAQDLYLRKWANGPVIDTLKYGTTFEVTGSAGGNWVYGSSYWKQRWGWVQNGWFC